MRNAVLKKLRHCQGGATAMEFALVAVPLFLLMFAIIEIGAVSFAHQVLETATVAGARLTAANPQGLSREQYIRNEVRRLSGGWMDPALLRIDTVQYDTVGPNQPEPCLQKPAPCPGVPGRDFVDLNGNGQWDAVVDNTGALIIYRVRYPWHYSTPWIWHAIPGDQADHEIISTSAVRNGGITR